MTASTRLMLCAVLIGGSVFYGVLVLEAPQFAELVAVGYIAILLTILTVINIWKKG